MKHVCLSLYVYVSLVCLTGCKAPESQDESSMPEAAPLSITWQVLSNLEPADGFTSELVLTNSSSEALLPEGWTLYFNFIRLIDTGSAPDAVRITHLNGDFYALSPTASFPSLAPGERVTIPFTASAWAIKKSDAPSGFYMVFEDEDNATPRIVEISEYTVGPFYTRAQTSRMAGDNLAVPSAASVYASNSHLRPLDSREIPLVVPSPVATELLDGSISLDSTTPVYFQEGLDNEAQLLTDYMGSLFNASLNATETASAESAGIHLRLSPITLPASFTGNREEAYHVRTGQDSMVVIEGATPKGVLYGIQTLRALMDPAVFARANQELVLPAIDIIDAPAFSYRGMHLDVSRNFQPAATVFKVLDLMAFYKLNTFHFHVTDDEGWRLEIPDLPELTATGATRAHTLDEQESLYPSHGSGPFPDRLPGSGYYSRQEFIEILQYATARHIEVITEIDVPGHARAAIKAMEARYHRLMREGDEEEAGRYLLTHPDDTSEYMSVQLWNDNVIDVCLPSSYAFLDKVFDELATMYRDAGAPLRVIHTGGDEVPRGVWLGSPACAPLEGESLHEHFLTSLKDLLEKHDVLLAGWEEIALLEEHQGGQVSKRPNPQFVDQGFLPYVWNNVWGWGMEDMAYRLANAGYPVVLSNATNLYFDLAYDKHPEEPGFYWAGFVDTYKAFSMTPLDIFKSATVDHMGNFIDRRARYANHVRLTASGRDNILGIQGQLWSERALSSEQMEYLMFPKLVGLAERAWAQTPEWASIENDANRAAHLAEAWNLFASQMGMRELPRLDYLHGGVSYRIPPPGAVIEGKTLHANVAFPGLQIRYTTASDPSFQNGQDYTGPVEVEGPVLLRSVATNGRASRIVSAE